MTQPAQQLRTFGESRWLITHDGDSGARALFRRHYSYRPYKDGRDPDLFVGPGEKFVLVLPDYSGLFVWRKFKSMDNQPGVNCSVFRNESAHLSSELILDAERYAWHRWPGERLYTYVAPGKVQSSNPGYCFLRAGWRKCGCTKVHHLLILEKFAPRH